MDGRNQGVRRERGSRVSLVGPVILIGLGVVFLLNNMGLLAWSVWDVIFRLWPVLLVAAGMEIILSRLSAWGSLLALVLTVAIFAGALWVLGPDLESTQAVAGEEIAQALGEASMARVVIEPGVGSLHIDALPESANLVEGMVSVGRGQRVSRQFRITGQTATFIVQTEGGTNVGPLSLVGWGENLYVC